MYLELTFTFSVADTLAMYDSSRVTVEGEASCTHLYSAVAPVCHNDVPIDIHGHSSGSVELTVAFTIGAEFQQKFPFCVEHLHNKGVTHYHHY